ncbi:MAG: cysteine dioxygenase [Sciscionella sp.]
MSDLTIDAARSATATTPASEVLRRIALCQARLTRGELAELVELIAGQRQLWRPVVRHDSEKRWYARLHRARNVEVWLIGWERGQDTRFHDHGGSSGAFAVVQGSLSEEYGHLERWHGVMRRNHHAGTARSFGPEYIHNLGNTAEHPATSVHAYSPPLSTMTYYRTEPDRLVPYETVVTAGPEPEIDIVKAAKRAGYFGEVMP